MLRRTALYSIALTLMGDLTFAADASPLVMSVQGTLPLLLTVPHDGIDSIGNVPTRRNGTVVRDVGTRPLAERVASILQQRTGKRPYLVVAGFSRKYLDANRAEDEAMESPEALPTYGAYHNQITSFVAELKSKYPNGALLIDVHGQGSEPNTTFRGTRTGLTVKALLAKFGAASIHGQYSITGALAAKGHTVHPETGSASLKEDPRYSGGYTVFKYGSQRADGIDAIQLEFGKNQRDSAKFAEDLADALLVFLTHHRLIS